MNGVTAQVNEFRRALKKNSGRYEIQVSDDAERQLTGYYELLLAWNARLHLVAPCSPAEFARRHVLESLLLIPYLRPQAMVADVGSGAGLPIIPALSARPDIHAMLIEASRKKAVFLREALRVTNASQRAKVLAERFEDIPTPEINHLTCRALDRFPDVFPRLVEWSPPSCTLLLFGGPGLQRQIEGAKLEFSAVKIPDSERRFLFVTRRPS